MVVAPFDSLRVGKASYTITGLFVNVAYGVSVSLRNDCGLSVPQFSTPARRWRLRSSAQRQRHLPARAVQPAQLTTAG